MPNWCYNNMTVYGQADDLKKLVKDISIKQTDETTGKRIGRLSFAHLYPVPAELLEYNAPLSRKDENGKPIHLSDEEREALRERFIAEYGAGDWYDWCCSHWGTKWGDCETNIDEEQLNKKGNISIRKGTTSIGIYYETAWSPADGLIRKVSELHPNLLFSVVSTEEAEMFACWSVFHNGKVVGDGYGETDIPKELAELYEKCSKDDLMDEYYEAHNEWQCERNDDLYDEARKCVRKYIETHKREVEKIRVSYLAKIMRLKEEMEKLPEVWNSNDITTKSYNERNSRLAEILRLNEELQKKMDTYKFMEAKL